MRDFHGVLLRILNFAAEAPRVRYAILTVTAFWTVPAKGGVLGGGRVFGGFCPTFGTYDVENRVTV